MMAIIPFEELNSMYKKVKNDNPGITDKKAYEIIAGMTGLKAHSVYLRFYNQRKTPAKINKEEKQIQKVTKNIRPENIRPDTYIGNKTSLRYKATGKGLIIQQNNVKENQTGTILVLSIEDFIQELQDCKEIF